ncbi:MAG: prepilin-type N-terminal cleavage/methylation domain-containing protein, partial [Bacilli bacterium]|nr:prepilin-type N-terminal cleavage/methylation domain-containing protein [Bacilli bacterium]
MKTKGFTIVELLTVIIIITLLLAIAVPSSIAISNRIKEKQLAEKYELAKQGAILWADQHQHCFTPSKSCSFLDYIASNLSMMSVKISIGKLAEDGFFAYDDKDKKTIENPVDKSDISAEKITVVFDLDTKTATSSLIEQNVNYTLAFNGNGANSGTMSSISCTENKNCRIPTNSYKKSGFG